MDEKTALLRKLYTLDLRKIIHRLVKKSWDEKLAIQISNEYRQFLYLLYQAEDKASLYPSDCINEFWDCHILHTADYLCMSMTVFGHYLVKSDKFGKRTKDYAYFLNKTQVIYFNEFKAYMSSVEQRSFFKKAVQLIQRQKVVSLTTLLGAFITLTYGNYMSYVAENEKDYAILSSSIENLFFDDEKSYIVCSKEKEYDKNNFLQEVIKVGEKRETDLIALLKVFRKLDLEHRLTKEAQLKFAKFVIDENNIYIQGIGLCKIRFDHPNATISNRTRMIKFIESEKKYQSKFWSIYKINLLRDQGKTLNYDHLREQAAKQTEAHSKIFE